MHHAWDGLLPGQKKKRRKQTPGPYQVAFGGSAGASVSSAATIGQRCGATDLCTGILSHEEAAVKASCGGCEKRPGGKAGGAQPLVWVKWFRTPLYITGPAHCTSPRPLQEVGCQTPTSSYTPLDGDTVRRWPDLGPTQQPAPPQVRPWTPVTRPLTHAAGQSALQRQRCGG
jgi:hypothetical protein